MKISTSVEKTVTLTGEIGVGEAVQVRDMLSRVLASDLRNTEPGLFWTSPSTLKVDDFRALVNMRDALSEAIPE